MHISGGAGSLSHLRAEAEHAELAGDDIREAGGPEILLRHLREASSRKGAQQHLVFQEVRALKRHLQQQGGGKSFQRV